MIAHLATAIALLCSTSASCPSTYRTHRGAESLAHNIEWAARQRNVSPVMMTALTWHESRWDARARSPRGAVGIAQVMPDIWAPRGLCLTRSYFCTRRQLLAGATALRHYRTRCVTDARTVAGYRSGACSRRLRTTAPVLATLERIRKTCAGDSSRQHGANSVHGRPETTRHRRPAVRTHPLVLAAGPRPNRWWR